MTNPCPSCSLVSVIITSKNEEATIAKCLKAVLDNDYQNFEVILLDDASHECPSKNDLPLTICRAWENTNLNKKRFFTLNFGQSYPKTF